MVLELRNTAEEYVSTMTNEEESLAFYGPQEGWTIHVTHHH